MSRAVTIVLLLAVLAALALRCPDLAERPMHNDEAVNAIKFRSLWEQGAYKYDPDEHHGPTLFYFTLAWAKLTRAPDFVHFDETRFRMLTVLFGVGLILLLPLVADGLGRGPTACAALLIAVSPAMVFYSRYYIHEMLLVFFTFLALAAGWRYTRSRKLGWTLLAGASVGLMDATKETFVLTLAAVAAALVLNHFWTLARVREPFPTAAAISGRQSRSASPSPPSEGGEGRGEVGQSLVNWKHFVTAFALWIVVALLFFSSFFTNASGPLDSLRTYAPWLNRAAGASPHIYPWNFYLTRLLWFHPRRGPIFSEALILALATIGGFAVLMRGSGTQSRVLSLGGNPAFLRFLGFYTLILTLVYSLISYKTPWCLLGFWHGMILLAGFGAAAFFNWLRNLPVKVLAANLFLLGVIQLGSQAWQASTTYAADQRNPYVYSQTSSDLLDLVQKVDDLARVNPQGQAMLIKVMATEGDYWPLPWYLRDFTQVGWWSKIPADPYAPVMIVSSKFNAALDGKKTHVMAGLFELRPQVFLELYVRSDLWRAYLASRATSPSKK